MFIEKMKKFYYNCVNVMGVTVNETIKNILGRVSVRKFTGESISDEDLNLIAECAKAAPTAMNKQLRQFTIVKDPEKIKKLVKAKHLGDAKYDMRNPTVLIIVSIDETCEMGELDTACAIENIYIAAHSLGLGSVWINQLRGNSYVPEIRKVLDSFGVPKNHVVWGMSALGVPAEKPESKERTEKLVFV